MFGSIIAQMADMYLDRKIAQQPLSWDSVRQAPISMLEYVLAYDPDRVGGDTTGVIVRDLSQIKSPYDLSGDEKKALACACLAQDTGGSALAMGSRSYTPKQLVSEIQSGSAVGTRMVEIMINNVRFLQTLVAAHKIHIDGELVAKAV